MNIKKINGFTLLEILVVVTIIGLLAAIGVVSYGSLLKGSRESRRKADLEQIRAALEIYKSTNGLYPCTSAACPEPNANLASWYGPCSGAGSHADDYVPGLVSTYINKLPHDPKEGYATANPISPANCTAAWNYCYIYKSNGTDYKLMANCGPETTVAANDPYKDWRTWTYQISSSGTSLGW